MASNTYCVEYAKTGRSGCKNKKCSLGKNILDKELRIGKLHPSPFSDDDLMVDWYHPICFFESMMRAMAKTIVPTSAGDFQGWETLTVEDEAMLQPLLDQFSKDRSAKLSGSAPKKPKAKASSASSSTSNTTSSSITKPSFPSLVTKPAPTSSHPSDPYGLNSILDEYWHSKLAGVLQALPDIQTLLGNYSPYLPQKSEIFSCIRGVIPEKVKLIFLQDHNDIKEGQKSELSGYALDHHKFAFLGNPASALTPFFKFSAQLKTEKNDSSFNLDHWFAERQKQNKTQNEFFEACKYNGILWMNTQLSIDPHNNQTSSNGLGEWGAVLLKIFKTILNSKCNSLHSNASGLVFVFLNRQNFTMESVKDALLRLSNRYEVKGLKVKFLNLDLPFASTDAPNQINKALIDSNNDVIDFFSIKGPSKSTKTAKMESDLADFESIPNPSAKSKPELTTTLNEHKPIHQSSSSSSSSSKPSTSHATTSGATSNSITTGRIQLTSMDGGNNLNVGKFHRMSKQEQAELGYGGQFLLRNLDLDGNDASLSSHVAVFATDSSGKIFIKPLAHNPIFFTSSKTKHASQLEAGKMQLIERGDLISFAADYHSYRIDPLDFKNPPSNHYMIESHDISEMQLDNTAPSTIPGAATTGIKKRPHSEIESDDEIEDHYYPPSKKVKQDEDDKSSVKSSGKKVGGSNQKSPAMDWMVDDGDGEFIPSKDDESPRDHIISNTKEGDSGSDGDVGIQDDELSLDPRPMCKYGSLCYQKNPAHIAKFKHPPKA